MSDNPLLKQLEAVIEPLLTSLGLKLWGLDFTGGGRGVLRVFIERIEPYVAETCAEDGEGETEGTDAALAPETLGRFDPLDAGIDECTHASRLIGLTLDVEDIIPSSYILEVSTPGLDRRFFTLEQLPRYLGEPAEFTLEQPIAEFPGRKRFSGKLAEVNEAEGFVVLDLTDPESGEVIDTAKFLWGNVRKAKLVYAPPPKPGTPASKKKNANNAGTGKKGKKK